MKTRARAEDVSKSEMNFATHICPKYNNHFLTIGVSRLGSISRSVPKQGSIFEVCQRCCKEFLGPFCESYFLGSSNENLLPFGGQMALYIPMTDSNHRYWKQPLCQLIHNGSPRGQFLQQYNLLTHWQFQFFIAWIGPLILQRANIDWPFPASFYIKYKLFLSLMARFKTGEYLLLDDTSFLNCITHLPLLPILS